jgi:hypothetical protein
MQCRGCGQPGTAVWEDVPHSQSLKRVLVSISTGFLPMKNPNPFGGATIVCRKCQQIQKL